MAYTNKIIDGGDILLKVGNDVIGCATSHSIEITNANREISCKGSGDWTTSEYGRFSWTASIDALFNLYDGDSNIRYMQLTQLMLDKQDITIVAEYVDPVTGDVFQQTGTAIIASISQTAPDSDNSSYSVSLMGKGALAITNTNLYNVQVTAVGAAYVIVEETGMIYPYPAAPIDVKLRGEAGGVTYNLVAYSSDHTLFGNTTVTVTASDTTASITLA